MKFEILAPGDDVGLVRSSNGIL